MLGWSLITQSIYFSENSRSRFLIHINLIFPFQKLKNINKYIAITIGRSENKHMKQFSSFENNVRPGVLMTVQVFRIQSKLFLH